MQRTFLPDKKWMLRAIALAKEAYACGEVPVGAVLVPKGFDENIGPEKPYFEAYNQVEGHKNPIAHAELLVIEKACSTLHRTHLENFVLYFTLAPCVMCSGAIVHAHIGTVVYAADNPDSDPAFFRQNKIFHPTVFPNLLEEEYRTLLQRFFKKLR